MFSRRIVITIPRSGVGIFTIGVISAMYIPIARAQVIIAIGIISGLVSIATVLEARHQLRTFRYEISDKITEILESYLIPEDTLDLRDSVEKVFEEAGVNGNSSHSKLRLPKRSNSRRANLS
jgi:hypothetical protein